MIPGMTNFPVRSLVSAPAGTLSWAAGPIQEIRPLSMITAAAATGARPAPSMSVKFLSTLTSARTGAPARNASNTAMLCGLGARIFEDPYGAGRIEDAAGAESCEQGGRLLRGPPVLLDEIDHLLRQRMADHAVSAHGGEHHHLTI